MKVARVKGGTVRQRKSFRLLGPVMFAGFAAAAVFLAVSGFSHSEEAPVGAAGLVLAVGSLCLRILGSRVHLKERSLVIVNPFFWTDIPYGVIYRAEVSVGGSLVVRLKDAEGDEDPFAVGFAGSLLDRYFKTTDRLAREINRRKKNFPKRAIAVKVSGVVLNPLADFQLGCAVLVALSSFAV